MSEEQGRSILLIDDDASVSRVYAAYLDSAGYNVTFADRGEAALELLAAEPFDLALLDLRLPDMDGLEILQHVTAQKLPVEIVVITGHGSMNTAIEAMRMGAKDFLVKPTAKERLLTTVENILETQKLSRIVETYRDDIDRHQFCGFVGSSLAMQGVYRIIENAAQSKATVFITGESGTGKELCADAIHAMSDRADKPLVVINCGAIPKDLVESELFGHVKGAFTGAIKDRVGSVSQANGGTLFLDEICELDVSLQPKLLRFLQSGTFQPVGGSGVQTVDVRTVCATNRDPWEEVNAGRFREDLYYRLHVLPVELPPLRDREGDVMDIANALLRSYAAEEGKEFNRFVPEVERVLESFAWPGNIRQLQNVVRNIVVFNDGDAVTPDMLPAPLDANVLPAAASLTKAAGNAPFTDALNMQDANVMRPLAEVEKDAIEGAIEHCGGNIPEAAFHLGISAATIYRKKALWRSRTAPSLESETTGG